MLTSLFLKRQPTHFACFSHFQSLGIRISRLATRSFHRAKLTQEATGRMFSLKPGSPSFRGKVRDRKSLFGVWSIFPKIRIRSKPLDLQTLGFTRLGFLVKNLFSLHLPPTPFPPRRKPFRLCSDVVGNPQIRNLHLPPSSPASWSLPPLTLQLLVWSFKL